MKQGIANAIAASGAWFALACAAAPAWALDAPVVAAGAGTVESAPAEATPVLKRGEFLPAAYLSADYRIEDPAEHGLPPVAGGLAWLRPADDRFVLVQAGTGLVLDVRGAGGIAPGTAASVATR